MQNKSKLLFLLVFISGLSLNAFAFHPKVKPGINEGTGKENVTDGSEAKLPIGLPFSITESPTASGTADEGDYSKIVYTFDLPDGQGPESFHETHSAFEQARSMNASCVLIRMNSMSGALDAAENLSSEISDYDKPVMVYVNHKAFPASTLISMAKDKNIPTTLPKQKQKSQPAKNRAPGNAASGNSWSVAYDDNICLNNSGTPFGKGFSSGQNGDLDEVLAQAGLNNYTVVHYSPGFFARIIDWCMKPVVSFLLVFLIAIGLRTQVRSVFPGPATFLLLVSLPLFGIPLFVGGLAGPGEFGVVIFLAVLTVIISRRKQSSGILKYILISLLIAALTFCESANPGLVPSWQVPVINFGMTATLFFAGWFLPAFLQRFKLLRAGSLSAA